jgi:hypothetical protein
MTIYGQTGTTTLRVALRSFSEESNKLSVFSLPCRPTHSAFEMRKAPYTLSVKLTDFTV